MMKASRSQKPPMARNAARQSQSAASVTMISGADAEPRLPATAWMLNARPMRDSSTAAVRMLKFAGW